MKNMGVNELRESFLSFFESKGHLSARSYSLVPKNDKSLLLIAAGMAPLKPYFTGQEIPPKTRMTTCQKCIRTTDIENVGKTARHGTFFEMLGNFSFGDYFKREAIAWAWEFLTQTLEFDPERLYVSVYEEDDEAEAIWHNEIGLSKDRIFRMGKEDNFWEHGSGPCGPCSEIYFDRGAKYGCGKPTCTVGCDCDRYMEIWNLVFTQYDRQDDGSYLPLAKKNIDTGMGLERLAAVMQGADSIFDVDTIKSIRDHVCRIAGVSYGADPKTDVSIRVITDHIRALTFMTSDGVLPSNEGRGYVLRRLLRRAARHGRLLGIGRPFLAELAETVVANSKSAYPELEDKKASIVKTIMSEEDKFYQTLDGGLAILQDFIAAMKENRETVLSGEKAFKLYDTYGFPADLTTEILGEEGMRLDEDGFRQAMESQRVRARQARAETNYMGAQATVYNELDPAMETVFDGYERTWRQGTILALTSESVKVDDAPEGLHVTVFTDYTPFYATMGGQEGDFGTIQTDTGLVAVDTTIKAIGEKIGHVGKVIEGHVSVGQKARLIADPLNRLATSRGHSATHLLQKALRDVLGTHVEQAGSSVSADRLRFDFTHYQAMRPEEIEKAEREVNRQILAALPITTEVMPMEKARQSGAMALFGEKYGENVRVVSMGDYSRELCGGTHLNNTAQIGTFVILSESGVAAGVRRIEALTGEKALAHFRKQKEELNTIASLLKSSTDRAAKSVENLLQQTKSLQKELETLKSRISAGAADEILKQAETVGGLRVLVACRKDLDMDGLRNLGDTLKEKLGECVILLAGGTDKPQFIAMATKGAVEAGANAGAIVREAAKLTGGGGGGKPAMAQAGGRDASRIEEALAAGRTVILSQIS